MKSYRVTLREQKNKSGRTSLYLDIYPPIYDEKKKKETRRKFLDLYLFEKPNGYYGSNGASHFGLTVPGITV